MAPLGWQRGFDKSPPERRETLLDNAAAIFADPDAGSGELPEDRLASIEIPTMIVDRRLSPSFLRTSRKRLLMPQARTVTLEQSSHQIGIDAREELRGLLPDVVARRDVAPTPTSPA